MSQMRSIVDFIYHGEVNVYQEDLKDFLEVSEELQLKGLISTYSSQEDTVESHSYQDDNKISKVHKQLVVNESCSKSDYEI